MLIKSVIVSIPVETNDEHQVSPLTVFYREYNRANRKIVLPTKHCFLLSHRGAALTPLETSAKNAFLTCKISANN